MNEQNPAGVPSPKKQKKTAIVVGVVAAVLVVAGAGMWVWHEQPSFCNAICHTPMDPYLPTYEAEPGSSATDKYGNEIEDASGMLAAVHRSNSANATCMSCHVPTLEEQMSEAGAWITGDYYAPLEERSLEDLVAARGLVDDEFCLNESCHNLTRDDLVEATSDMGINPHYAQHGTLECSDCHKAHTASVNACSKCHSDAEIPEGWVDYEEYEANIGA